MNKDNTLLFYSQTQDIIRKVCHYVTTGMNKEDSNGICSKIQRDVKNIIIEHPSLHSLVNQLQIKSEADLSAINDMAATVFEDNIINWGRIVILISCCALIVKHCENNGVKHSIDIVTNKLVIFILENLRPWIEKQGGWKMCSRK